MPLNFTAWISVRKTVAQSNYSIIYFETWFQTKCDTVKSFRTKKNSHFQKTSYPHFPGPFHYISLKSKASLILDFSWPLPSWFPLAEPEKLTNSRGKTRKQWWSIFSITLTISVVPVRQYNCSWHCCSLLLESDQKSVFIYNSQSSYLILQLAIKHLWHCLFSVASAVHFVVAVGLQKPHCWRCVAWKSYLTLLCKELAKRVTNSVVRDSKLAPPLACHFFTHIRRTSGWKEIRRFTTALPTAQTSKMFCSMSVSWHQMVQWIFIIWVQDAWSDWLRHIPLCLCYPTPAPHRLQTRHYSARRQLWCWGRFLAEAECFVCDHDTNTQHSHRTPGTAETRLVWVMQFLSNSYRDPLDSSRK